MERERLNVWNIPGMKSIIIVDSYLPYVLSADAIVSSIYESHKGFRKLSCLGIEVD